MPRLVLCADLDAEAAEMAGVLPVLRHGRLRADGLRRVLRDDREASRRGSEPVLILPPPFGDFFRWGFGRFAFCPRYKGALARPADLWDPTLKQGGLNCDQGPPNVISQLTLQKHYI